MKLVIDINENVRVAIDQMGLLRIPDEMQKKVDKAIQHGTPISDQEPIKTLEQIITEIDRYIDPEKLRFNGQFDSGLNLAKKIVLSKLDSKEMVNNI